MAVTVNDSKKTKLHPLVTTNLQIGFGVDVEYGGQVKLPHPPIQKLERNFEPGCYIVQEAGSHPVGDDDVEPDDKTTYIVEDYPPLGPETYSLTPDGRHLWFQNYPLIKHPIDLFYEHQGKLNIVMALIDVSASESIDDVLKDLKQQLVLWRKSFEDTTNAFCKITQKESMRILAGQNIKYIQTQMGHASINITLDILRPFV
jgi:hypothetical protein